MKVTVTEGSYITLTDATANGLDGKDDLLLSLDVNGKAVLYDGTSDAIAVMVEKPLGNGTTEIRARLLGKGGTVRVIQNAAITPGGKVQGRTANARVEAATAGKRVLGYKLTGTAGGAGEVIELADSAAPSRVPSADTLTALNFSAQVTQAEGQALRDAVKALLQAQGLMA